MSFPRYPKYLESGVEWFTQVPSHWSIQPCRSVFTERNERNDPRVCDDYLSLMANVGIIPYAEKGDVGNKMPEDIGKCKQVFPGDLVINSMNYGIGSYGLSALRGVCSPVYIVLTPKLNKIKERFAFRILESKDFQKFAQSFGNGILEHRAAINWEILKVIGIPVPPLEEQELILALLDKQTAKIDSLIVEQEKLIELLKEKRQAVISHAVTKGLDPNAKMKDSGIGWLGSIPLNWKLCRIKYLSKLITKGTTPTTIGADFVDQGIRFIKAENISDNEVLIEPETYIDVSTHAVLSRSNLCAGDVLVVIAGATTGRSAVLDQKLLPCNTNQAVALIRPINSRHSNLIKNWISTTLIQDRIRVDSVQSAQPNLSMESLGNIYIPVPPSIDEIILIEKEVKKRTSPFTQLIYEANFTIDLLRERRTALISAAVTGQIDIRNGAAELEFS